jgi:two-component system, cell cycle sensor histidine kinase and response regulator CckA
MNLNIPIEAIFRERDRRGAHSGQTGQEHERNHHTAQIVEEGPQRDAVLNTAANDSIRVLVVDDDDGVRQMVSDHLEEQGYNVIVAATGQSAYDIIRLDQNINIVISDVMMPGMDGVMLAGLLRAERPNLPIVFINGCSSACGLRGEIVLAKPFTAATLAALVAGGLGRVT